jgi:FkbM family methyltransferase
MNNNYKKVIKYILNKLRLIKWSLIHINHAKQIQDAAAVEVDLSIASKLVEINPYNIVAPVVLDIGANIGLYCFELSKKINRHDGKCIAFEPRSDNYSVLCDRNHHKNLVLENFAVSNTIGTVNLYLNASHGKNSLIKYDEFIGFGSEVACTVTLDSYLSVNKVENVFFVKVDVEGHELEVIEGYVELIKRDWPIILCEVENRHLHPQNNSVEKFIEYFSSLGYVAFVYDSKNNRFLSTSEIEIPQSKPSANELYYFNYWFVHRSKSQEIIKILNKIISL